MPFFEYLIEKEKGRCRLSNHCKSCGQYLKPWEIDNGACEECILKVEGISSLELFTDETEFEQDLFYDGLSAGI